ncbi:MAG: hypothetical protein LBN23_02040 [Paludibacter sp.]|nr:hypothetical protein [Paludibacter sp.]
MKTTLKILIATVAVATIFAACSKNDHEALYGDYVTVENPDSVKAFYMTTDAGTRLYTQTTNFIPAHRSRYYVLFTASEKMPAGSAYDYEVKLTSYQNILTKDIFNITPATQDSIGHDPIGIQNIWIASNYLNIYFVFYRSDYPVTHYINLVADSTKNYNDNALHFEFRHNAKGDYSAYQAWSAVSFDLLPLKENAVGDSLTLVVHAKEFSTNADKTYTIGYKFTSDINKINKLDNNHNFSTFALFQ